MGHAWLNTADWIGVGTISTHYQTNLDNGNYAEYSFAFGRRNSVVFLLEFGLQDSILILFHRQNHSWQSCKNVKEIRHIADFQRTNVSDKNK